MESVTYKWTKTYAVQTAFENAVKVGDVITVGDRNGGSKQEVQSVTVMYNKAGQPYKTLLLRAVENIQASASA
jgi:hypothetical protein